MTAPKIRNCDKGTEYAKALIDGAKVGAARATDAQVMAMFCEHTMQLVVGAVSPRLVWEGAQRSGLTALQLHNLCADRNLSALDDLQFGPPKRAPEARRRPAAARGGRGEAARLLAQGRPERCRGL